MKKQQWDSQQIGDQQGKVAIVTGANSGIGLETARVLAGKGARVVMAVRNLHKGEVASAKITRECAAADIALMELDLADLGSVKRFADAFTGQYDRLDLLINNAGVMVPPYGRTVDGFEMQFGTNYLGHFALTGRLFALIRNTPGSRVVNLSSLAHTMGRIDFDDLAWEKRKYKKWQAYGDSKLAALYFTYALKYRYGLNGSGVKFAAAHPGWTATELQRNTGLVNTLNYLFAQQTDMGALPTLYAAVADEVENGDYIGPDGCREFKGYPKKVQSNVLSHNPAVADRLWRVSEQLTGVRFPTSS